MTLEVTFLLLGTEEQCSDAVTSYFLVGIVNWHIVITIFLVSMQMLSFIINFLLLIFMHVYNFALVFITHPYPSCPLPAPADPLSLPIVLLLVSCLTYFSLILHALFVPHLPHPPPLPTISYFGLFLLFRPIPGLK